MATEHAEETSDLDVPMIVTIGVVSVALTIALILAIQALYYRSAKVENERKVVAAGDIHQRQPHCGAEGSVNALWLVGSAAGKGRDPHRSGDASGRS